jgi:hypothetical protein
MGDELANFDLIDSSPGDGEKINSGKPAAQAQRQILLLYCLLPMAATL